MNSKTNNIGRWLLFVMLVSMSLLFSGHLASGYLILKRIAINVALLILLLMWGREFFREEKNEVVVTPVMLPLAIFLLISLLSFSKAINPFEGLDLWIGWLDACLLIFLVANFFKRDIIVPSINVLIGSGWLIAIYGIFQEFGIDWVKHISPHTPFSTFGNVNWAAQFLVVLCPLALTMLISAREPLKRLFAGGGLALFLIHLFLTQSRGGWLAVIVSGIFIGFWTLFRSRTLISPGLRKRIILSVLVGLIAFTFFLIVKPDTAKKLFASSNNTRLLIWQASLKIWEDNPLLGIGMGNFRLIYPRYRLDKERLITSKDVQVDQTHNEYLQVLTDSGIVGFGVFVYFLFVLFKMSRKALGEEDNEDYLLNLGFIGVIIGVLIHSLISFPLQGPASLMGFILAITFLAKLSNQEEKIEFRPAVWQRFLFYFAFFTFCIFSFFYHSKRFLNDYWFNRGQIEFQAENYTDSITSLNKATAVYPFNFRPWLILGYAQNKVQNYPAAAKAYEKGNNLCPNYYLARHQLGNIYKAMERFQEAIIEYDSSLALVADNPAVIEAKSEAQRLQNIPLATRNIVPNLQEALTSNIAPLPEKIKERVERAREYEKAGNFKKAIVEYQAINSLDPSLIMINYNLGMIYLKTEEFDKAMRHFEEITATDELPPPPRADALSQIGYILFLKKDFKKAEDYFTRAVKIDPESVRGNQFLGNLYFQQNRKKEALAAWKRALKSSPESKIIADNVRVLSRELAR